MSELYLDLLREPWISTLDASGKRSSLDLAEVLERLGASEELEFTALRGHQQQPWFAFLCQVATLALERAESRSLDVSADRWRGLIGGLAADPAAFYLAVGDLSRPAFFQPPVPEQTLAKWSSSTSPDFLDVRITAKNFDVKSDGFIAPPDPEHWCFALITLQTMQGFLGRGNYGIARMNGGFGSRAEAGFAPGLGWAARWRRDVPILLDTVEEKRQRFGYASGRGLSLLWTEPWGGAKAETLDHSELEPNFLEVCRRIRLAEKDRHLAVHGVASKAPRIDTGKLGGNLGDPWTVVRIKDEAPLTLSDGGFHYRLLSQLLFSGDYATDVALSFQPSESGPMIATFRALARGQGKTGGFHERQILIDGPSVRAFLESDAERLADMSKERVEIAGNARSVLKLGLIALVQEKVHRPSGERYDLKDTRPDAWVRKLDREIDRVFFQELFKDLADPELDLSDVPSARWQRCLYDLAKIVFNEACEALEPSGDSRFRARARAQGIFYSQAQAKLPGGFADLEEAQPASQSQIQEALMS